MKVLVIGKGGRENALVWKIAQSPLVTKIFALPGNIGMKKYAELVNIQEEDIHTIADFAKEQKIDLTIVGPEIPLVKGIVDVFIEHELTIFGPSKDAAQLEGSKAFMKALLKKHNIPTADYHIFNNYDEAKIFLEKSKIPIVIKADGLAAGKGVVVAKSLEQALTACKHVLIDKKFGSKNTKVVIEDYMEGEEFSLIAFVNGTEVYPLPAAKDYKRAFDQDKGGNTGGMGAYSPVPSISQIDYDYAVENIMKPTAKAMQTEGKPFIGVLYGGMMVTPHGVKVIEFNVRFGDPETEVLLPRLETDLIQHILDVLAKKPPEMKWSSKVCLGVVMASIGYPNEITKNVIIRGVENISEGLFHMGTSMLQDRQIVNIGGRVLFIYGLEHTFAESRKKAYQRINQIHSGGLFYRKDIGEKLE